MLESATEWEITEEEEFTVTLAAHKGEEWIKNRETMKRKTAMEKGQHRSGEDREWISKMLAKDSTKIVSSQQVVIVAPTPSGHQDAGTIKLDPEARRKEEEGKEKEKEEKNEKGGGKGIGRGKGKGKGKAPKISPPANRVSPPITRARKRARLVVIFLFTLFSRAYTYTGYPEVLLYTCLHDSAATLVFLLAHHLSFTCFHI